MKKGIFLLILCFSITNLYAQNEKKNMIGTYTAFGTGAYGRIKPYEGGGSYNTKYYYTIGLDYSRTLSERWDLCSGLEYTYNDMTIKPSFTGVGQPLSNVHLTLVTVPVQFKYHFGKLAYFNGGTFLNILAKDSDKYRPNVAMLLGIGFGIGFKHEFNSGIMLSLNPYTRFNGIGNLSLHSESIKDYKYLQGGVSFGVGYKF